MLNTLLNNLLRQNGSTGRFPLSRLLWWVALFGVSDMGHLKTQLPTLNNLHRNGDVYTYTWAGIVGVEWGGSSLGHTLLLLSDRTE